VNTAISQMDKIVQASAAQAEEGAGVAQELTAQATAIQNTIDELARVVGGNHGPRHSGSLTHPTAAPVARRRAQPRFADPAAV
jgi:hypothetical protein